MKHIPFLTLVTFLILTACNSQKKASSLSFLHLEPGNIAQGDTLTLQLDLPAERTTDSVLYFVNDQLIRKSKGNEALYFDSSTLSFGPQQLTARHYENGEVQEANLMITVVSDKAPEQYSFSVVNTFPHDPEAFTQGLEYSDGMLYESTGEYGSSTLRKVELTTGKVIQQIKLPDSQFGEGLTLVDDKIVQLTWREGRGLVYDKTSFEKVSEFNYQASREGWGICYDGEKLIKSDGSNRLYFLDKNTFQETGKFLEVYDHNGPVDELNELEYIDGKIFANVYLTDKIVVIDPTSGKVEGELNLIGLLPQKDQHPDQVLNGWVLNGIAYDRQAKRIFVTGKKWNTLFEIRMIGR
jgi:glutamine cyclotransferase